MAQVYSANVVGYVNVTLPANNFALIANPLTDGTNTANSLLAALPNKSTIQLWNGSGYSGASKGGGVWTPDVSIPTGTGFFALSPTAVTNTFVGEVIVGPGETNSVALAAGQFSLVGSAVPYSGNLNDAANTQGLNLGASLPNKSSIQVWNGTGYTGSSKGGGVWNPDLTISVGQGFFVLPAAAATWNQSLPSN
jgi:hypothetical protein